MKKTSYIAAPNRHFILTSGRSGSNYLANTLNKHPNIVNYGEVLGEWTLPYKLYSCMSPFGVKWGSFLNALYQSTSLYYVAQFISVISHLRRGEKIGFKNYSDIASIGIKDFAFLVRKRNLSSFFGPSANIKIIYLYRQNIFKRYLSLVRMQQSGKVKTESTETVSPIYVDPKHMLIELALYEKELQLQKDIVASIPKDHLMKIKYEDYFNTLESIASTNKEVFDFLGVEPIEASSKQRKIGSDDLSSYISNYDEICSVLSGTEYVKYLEM